MKRRFLSTFILIMTGFFWGLAFVAQVLGGDSVDVWTFNGTRFVLGSIVLLPVIFFFEKEKMTKRTWMDLTIYGAITGVIVFGASALQQIGASLTRNPGKSGFITGLYIVMTPMFYSLFFHRKAGWKVWVSAIGAATGLYFLCCNGEADFTFGLGELFLLLGAVLWTAHIALVDRFVAKIPPLKYSCAQFLTCGILNLLLSFLLGTFSVASVQAGALPILYCAVFSVGVGYTGQIVGQKLCGDPSRAAILLSTESLFSATGSLLWNLVAPSETLKVEADFGFFTILGCVLIFSSIILSQWQSKKARQAFESK